MLLQMESLIQQIVRKEMNSTCAPGKRNATETGISLHISVAQE